MKRMNYRYSSESIATTKTTRLKDASSSGKQNCSSNRNTQESNVCEKVECTKNKQKELQCYQIVYCGVISLLSSPSLLSSLKSCAYVSYQQRYLL